MTYLEAHKLSRAFDLTVDRSQIGHDAWGVRDPKSPGFLMTEKLQVVAHLASLAESADQHAAQLEASDAVIAALHGET